MRFDWRQCVKHARSPVGLSIILHVVIIVSILLASIQQHKVYQVSIRVAQSHQPVKVVQASVVSQAAYDRQQQEKQRLEQQRIDQQRAAERRARLAEQRRHQQAVAKRKAYLKRLAAERAAQKAKQQKQKQRQAQAKRQKIAAKKRAQQRQRELAKQRLQQQKKLAQKKRAEKLARQRAIAEKLKQQALNSLGQQITADQKAQQAAQAQQQQWLTERQKYIGLIQQTIRSNWINQFSQSDQLTVVLLISLNLQGQVESVQVVQSSGNAAFDRQAILAVRKSSPLPMPKDKALAKQFEHIKLPFSNIA